MRWPALALVALLAGCASPPEVAVAPAEAEAEVYAIRIIPVNHTVTWREPLEARPCGLPTGEPCEPFAVLDATRQGPVIGVEAPAQERRATDSGALLWRLQGMLDIQDSTANPEVELRIFVTRPTGGPEREVLRLRDSSALVVERTDIFLQQGERDLRFTLSIQQDYLSTLAEPVRVHGELVAQAFIDAGDEPVRVG